MSEHTWTLLLMSTIQDVNMVATWWFLGCAAPKLHSLSALGVVLVLSMSPPVLSAPQALRHAAMSPACAQTHKGEIARSERAKELRSLGPLAAIPLLATLSPTAPALSPQLAFLDETREQIGSLPLIFSVCSEPGPSSQITPWTDCSRKSHRANPAL